MKTFLFVLMALVLATCTSPIQKPVPDSANQMILVLTDSMAASSGRLYRFQRSSGDQEWQRMDIAIPIVLGRNGLAWGRGLHELDPDMAPVKVEGDGCSPAGVFRLEEAFGYTHPDSLTYLQYPYLHNTELLECVDDIESYHYNKLVYRDRVDLVDWNSSERMGHYGRWYEWGIVVGHNRDPIIKGSGSCIFLHCWFEPDETTSGCTEMAPQNMFELIKWLDADMDPIIVQLPQEEYLQSSVSWELPEVTDTIALGREEAEKLSLLRNKCLKTLAMNTQDPTGALYHRGIFPSKSVSYFNGFWAWDSWKHAAALAAYQPELAKDQIKAMFDWQASNGMIPDVIYADSSENNWRNTKPPLAAWAVWEIYDKTADVSFIKEMYPRLKLYHAWWYSDRDHDRNGICEYGSTDGSLIAAKWESGMDNAVRFDSSQVVNNKEKAWSLTQESVDLNAYLYAEKIYLAKMATLLGLDEEKQRFIKTAGVLKKAATDRLFNGSYFHDRRFDNDGWVTARGPEGWIPLWAGMVTQEQAELVWQNMQGEGRFDTFLPFPTVERMNPEFSLNYWRGPVWLDQAYFAVTGLLKYGYKNEARQLTRKLIRNLEGAEDPEYPLYENYNPLTGEGLNAPDFSWTAAHLLLLIDTFWPGHSQV